MDYYEDFLSWFRRGGGALSAESTAWGHLETLFGETYVPHAADASVMEEVLHWVSEDRSFVMLVVGIPGVGKTLLLKKLTEGISTHNFPDYVELAAKLKDTCVFLDIDMPGKTKEDVKRLRTDRKIIWVTTNLDNFVSMTGEAEIALDRLEEDVDQRIVAGDSLIVFGNIGVLGQIEDENNPTIMKICHIVGLRASGRFRFQRIPRPPNLWVKEFGGLGKDYPFVVGGRNDFQRYSLKLVEVAKEALKYMRKMTRSSVDISVHEKYLQELYELLLDSNFMSRLHRLLLYLWFRHKDVYFTPRALNIFWGRVLKNLWEHVEGGEVSEDADRTLIYISVYYSFLPSVYKAAEYSLTETDIHRVRDIPREKAIVTGVGPGPLDQFGRNRHRIRWYFEEEGYEERIAGGVFEEYLNDDSLKSRVTEILRNIAWLRTGRSGPPKEADGWDWKRILLSVEVRIGRKPLWLFHERIFDTVSIADRVVTDYDKLMLRMNREKRLTLRVSSDHIPPEKVPAINLRLDDLATLRRLLSSSGRPDLELEETSYARVTRYLQEFDGMTNLLIKPMVYDLLRESVASDAAFDVKLLAQDRVCDVDVSPPRKLIIRIGDEATEVDTEED